MSFVLAAFVGLSFPAAAFAGDAADIHARLASRVKEPELRDMTERVLREMNIDYSKRADKNLQDKGEKFDHARLEITGVMSNDPTEAIEPGLFDRFVKPSFSNHDEKLGFIDSIRDYVKRLASPALDLSLDIKDYKQAASGIMTERAAKVLDAYKGKEINEIVAHSWGCELIYAAILNGEMKPPKKLIAVGVPDDDFAKWEELARRTGTAVIWVRAKNDKVASNGAALVKGSAGDFKAAWDAFCTNVKTRAACNAHGRKPSVAARVVLANIPGVAGHDRKEYYAILKDMHLLKGGFLKLRAAEQKLKESEVIDIQRAAFDEALTEARRLIELSKERMKIAQRDHDDKLRSTLVEMALRSCANPGSVAQSELDRLPRPYRKDFYFKEPGSDWFPDGLGDCLQPYDYLGQGGRNAEILRRGGQVVNAPVNIVATPVSPAPPAPVPAQITARIPFFAALPRLHRFAQTSCQFPGKITIDESLFSPSTPFSFSKEDDDRIAGELSSGRSTCEDRLFRRLIEVIRSGQGDRISTEWVKETVATYSPAPDSTPRYAPPRRAPEDPDDGCFIQPGVGRWCPPK